MRTLGGSVVPRSVFAGNVKIKGRSIVPQTVRGPLLPCLVPNFQKTQLKDIMTC
jgi:hypothetical protein